MVANPDESTGQVWDQVFDAKADNESIMSSIGNQCVENLFKGFNSTVFVYGQTGSGKTHTMTGSAQDAGLTPRCSDQIFEMLKEQEDRCFLIRARYVEIYNEKVYDLTAARKVLQTRYNKGREMFEAVGCKETHVRTSAELCKVRRMGDANRQVGQSHLNSTSSRSHSCFTVIVESTAKQKNKGTGAEKEGGEENEGEIRMGQLTLVDLAGSETLSSLGDTQQKETLSINKSLSALKDVIVSKAQQAPHIPFRNSELTKLLMPSLGGNSITHMILCIHPEVAQQRESKYTLAFGTIAQKVENRPRQNIGSSDTEALLRCYRREREELQAKRLEVEDLQSKLKDLEGFIVDSPHAREMEAKAALLEQELDKVGQELGEEQALRKQALVLASQRDAWLANTLAEVEERKRKDQETLDHMYAQMLKEVAEEKEVFRKERIGLHASLQQSAEREQRLVAHMAELERLLLQKSKQFEKLAALRQNAHVEVLENQAVALKCQLKEYEEMFKSLDMREPPPAAAVAAATLESAPAASGLTYGDGHTRPSRAREAMQAAQAWAGPSHLEQKAEMEER
ncbi:unnamed protein product [Chrysoparadoxa australica]